MAEEFILWRLLYWLRCALGPVSAAARRLDDEDVARRHLGLVERAELGHGAVGAQHMVAPRLPGSPARHAVRADPAMSREDGGGHRLEEAHAPHRAVAAAPAAAPARAAADGKAFQQH